MKRRIGTLILCMILCLVGISAEAQETDRGNDSAFQRSTEEAEYQTIAHGDWSKGSFSEALENVYDGGIVRLLRDVTLENAVTISKKLTLTSAEGENYIISTQTNAHGYLLKIIDGEVSMDHVVVDGGSKDNITSTRALIAVGDGTKNGKLTLEDSVIIRNNNNTTTFGLGGGICLISGELTVNNAKICGNNAYMGGGIGVSNGTVNINSDALICDNTSVTSGGGVSISNGTVIMNDGVISDNVCNMTNAGGGGGVYIYTGSFTLNNGKIIGNSTSDKNGGGIYSYKGTANIFGGEIKENHAKNVGGAIMVDEMATLNLTGGVITDNSADNFAGGVECSPNSTINIWGSPVVKNNTSKEETDGGIYIDGAPNYAWPNTFMGALTDNASLHFYTWAETEDFLIASAYENYHITESDMKRLVYQNDGYYLYLGTDETSVSKQQQIVLKTKKEITITASDIKTVYSGQNVSDNLICGTAKYEDEEISGTWYFKDSAPKMVSDSGEYKVMFVPDSPAYQSTEYEINVTIEKKVVTVKATDIQAYLNDALPDMSQPLLDTDYKLLGIFEGDTLSENIIISMKTSADMNKEGVYEILIFVEGEDECYTFITEPGELKVSEKNSEPPSDEIMDKEPDKDCEDDPPKDDSQKDDLKTDDPVDDIEKDDFEFPNDSKEEDRVETGEDPSSQPSDEVTNEEFGKYENDVEMDTETENSEDDADDETHLSLKDTDDEGSVETGDRSDFNGILFLVIVSAVFIVMICQYRKIC